jgi:hypothetical protein
MLVNATSIEDTITNINNVLTHENNMELDELVLYEVNRLRE